MKVSMVPCFVSILSRVPRSSSAFQQSLLVPTTFVRATGTASSLSSSSSSKATVTTTAKTTTSNRFGKSKLFSSSSKSTMDNLTIQGPDIPPVPKSSKRLFLVRHGEVINPGGDRPVYYGALDVSLSPLGQEEAKVAAEYLKQFDLQIVAASPLSRAKFGANEVLVRQQQTTNNNKQTDELKIFTGFTELDRGAWCGQTKDEIGSDMMARFDACDESATPEGGESYPQLKERVLEARDDLLNSMDCGVASAVVSHLQVTRCMLSDAHNIPTEEMCNFKIATASVACIDYDADTGSQTVHFQNFKPDVGLEKSVDGAN